MKILFLTHYYPPEGNAPASRVSALAERWTASGHKVTVVTCAPNVPNGIVYNGYENRRTEEIVKGVNVIRVKTYIAPNKGAARRIINYLSYMFSAVRACLFMKKPDIMIATSPQFFCGWAGVLLYWIRRFPFILEVRDIWPESVNAVGAGIPVSVLKIIGIMEKIMYRAAKHIVTVGEGYKERLIGRGVPSGKISIVMNGVDRKMFYPRGKNEALLSEHGLKGKFICSYIGTIGMACGLETAVEAGEILKKKGKNDIIIYLIGDGAQKETLAEEARQRKLDNIIFAGLKPKNEIADWICSSDVSLVHLKKTDLFKTVIPSKIFESAGCAKPILIGVEGYAAKLVLDAEAGIAIEPENAAAMAEGIIKLRDDPELCKKLGENALNNIAEKYDRDAQAKMYIDIISDLK